MALRDRPSVTVPSVATMLAFSQLPSCLPNTQHPGGSTASCTTASEVFVMAGMSSSGMRPRLRGHRTVSGTRDSIPLSAGRLRSRTETLLLKIDSSATRNSSASAQAASGDIHERWRMRRVCDLRR